MAKTFYEVWAIAPKRRRASYHGSFSLRHWQFAMKRATILRSNGYRKVRVELVQKADDEEKE